MKAKWLKIIEKLGAKTVIAIIASFLIAGSAFAYYQLNLYRKSQEVIKAESKDNKQNEKQPSQNNVATQQTTPVPTTESSVGNTQVKTSKPVSTTTNSYAAVATNTEPPSSPPTPPPPPSYPDTYPSSWASATKDSILDTWGMNNRESVSYCAWKVNEAYGNMPAWGRQGKGNAAQWPSAALSAGIPTGTTPKVHSVGISIANGIPGIGLSAWIEAIDGSNVVASSYNWTTDGTYIIKTAVPASYFETYIYFGDR